ncbi:PEPxxWA-CTERM sorting domain-containing protein [Sphingomonas sp. ID0503]|uniref:PEPxxWA-CTERM sorting domain-containing protein n=1 Tax=Sphingomonas sp. ID0503 TaxID=3399691 RepID=UPI003AFB80A9
MPALAATYTLGQQDYADGTITSFADYSASAAGEAAPFDQFYGSDVSSNFDKTFTFSYAPGSVTDGSLTFGIYDHDSSSPGSQLAYFGVNGIDLTASLNALFEGAGGEQQQVSVYTLALSGSALAALSTGSAAFRLTLQPPANNDLPFNGAGLDFASLTINANPAVPEPASWAMMIAGFGLVGGAMRRRAAQVGFAG